MKNFAIILIAIILAQFLFSAGLPPWVLLIATTLALLFWHRFLGVVAAGLIRLSRVLENEGVAGASALRSAVRWLTTAEGVRAADGGWMEPSGVDDAIRAQDQRAEARAKEKARRAEAEQRKAEEKARKAALRAEAEAIFDAHAEKAVFLIEERNGYRRSKSKIGGHPTLPSGIDWPDIEGFGLHFLAEVHLDEVPRGLVSDALPDSGVLYFFLGLGEFTDLMTGRVLYAPEAGPHRVKRHPNLGELQSYFTRHPGQDNVLIETAVRPTVATVPHLSTFDYGAASKDLNICLGEISKKRYKESVSAAGHINGRQHLKFEEDYVYNMVGGPKLDIPNATMGHGVKLLQLDSAGSLGLQFGDMGVVEFWIDEDDLREGRFDRAFVDGASC